MDRSTFFTRLRKSAEISNSPFKPKDPRIEAAEQKSTFSGLVKMGSTIQDSPFANYGLTLINRNIPGGLGAYNGVPTYATVSHLVKRTCFNASVSQINALVGIGNWTSIFNQLFSSQPLPPAPVNPAEIQTNPLLPYPNTTGAFIGVSSPYSATLETQRNTLIYSQWNDLILNSPINIKEKMVVFLSSLLVEQEGTIGDARFFYGYLNLLRTNATGNYKNLVKGLVIDPGMLVYLNGYQSTKLAPNENFGRELQELFTIGKGPQTTVGDYTTYSETDVQAAARVLTGWNVTAYKSNGMVTAVFNPADHDISVKKFSPDYGGAVINNNDALEYGDLIDLIFKQNATAIYIVSRFYKEFVYYYIDSNTMSNIIIPLANSFRSNNYEILPLLQQLLQSQHFFDSLNIGCVIKNPITFTAGLQRNLGIQSAGANVISEAGGLSMGLGNPDQVAGWKATYETPDLSEWWINSITMENRTQLTDQVVQSNPDAIIAIAQGTSNPADPNALIADLANLFFPSSLTSDYPGPITSDQHDFLKGILLPGLPDFEWNAQIWGPYMASSTKAGPAYVSLAGRLTGLFKFMFSMAEYHLS